MSIAREHLKARALSTFSAQGPRPCQEDQFLVDRERGIYVMADGFGGLPAGIDAAKISCETIRSYLFKEAGDQEATFPFVLRTYFSLAGNVLFNSLIYANRKLRGMNQSKSVHERGGASVIAAFMDGDLLSLANVGVCTAWLMRAGSGVDLVIPRSYRHLTDPFHTDRVNEVLAPLMALGICEDLEPEITEVRIQAGDWLVLATDGIPDQTRKQLIQLQDGTQTPDQAVQKIDVLLSKLTVRENASMVVILF